MWLLILLNGCHQRINTFNFGEALARLSHLLIHTRNVSFLLANTTRNNSCLRPTTCSKTHHLTWPLTPASSARSPKERITVSLNELQNTNYYDAVGEISNRFKRSFQGLKTIVVLKNCKLRANENHLFCQSLPYAHHIIYPISQTQKSFQNN